MSGECAGLKTRATAGLQQGGGVRRGWGGGRALGGREGVDVGLAYQNIRSSTAISAWYVSRGLGIEAVGRVAVKKLARNVGPELLEDGAESALGGDDQAVGEGLAPAGVLRRVIEIGDGRRQ